MGIFKERQQQGTVVVLLTPLLGPGATAGAGPHTPVRLATLSSCLAESASIGPGPFANA
ncbi:hypothetical protein GCM10020000_80570 [Streptomyces olivoverticillatus]